MLTDAQREANRAARLVRDREYRARRKEYDAARKAVENSDLIVQLRIAAEAASRKLDREIEKRQLWVANIKEQIAALQEQLKSYDSPELQMAKLESDKAWEIWRQRSKELAESVDKKFSDVAHCWSAASWKANGKA